MSIGPERVQTQPQGGSTEGAVGDAIETSAAADSGGWITSDQEEGAPRPAGGRILAALLILLAAGWLGAVGYAIYRAQIQPEPTVLATWAAIASAPLILLGLAWLIFGRSSRRETERFTQAVAAMRRESQTLEAVLAIVSARLEENRARLSEEAARLMALGDEASDRLGRVTHYIARESAELERRAQALDSASATARVDIGVLLSDLPKAEEQARAVAESMKEAGLNAHQQAAALESQLAALAGRGREADEVVGGAAQRLGAHIARIETGAGAAAQRMDEAAAQMNAAVDGAMARASNSVDQARSGLEAQGQAMLAMVDQSRAAFESAGAEASRRLSERLASVAQKVEEIAGHLAAQDAASQAMVTGLAKQLADVDDQIACVGRSGDEQQARLSQSMTALREMAASLQREVEAGHTQSGELIGRTRDLSEALVSVAARLRDELPPALAGVEAQAQRTEAAALAAVQPIEAVQAAAVIAADCLTESESSIGRQRESLDALLAAVRDGAREAEERLRALGASAGEADEAAAQLVKQTGPALIDTLVRVREAANQAAAHARDAIAAVIPESVAALVEASREAVGSAVTEPVREQLAGINAASQQAVTTAQKASERLTRQLLAIGETAATIEARIEGDRAAREQKEAEGLSRRVALIIEALNSTAIDVTKILSNEVTDTAWMAYLKGDRGVFTRRAVRLLDSGEAREVVRHYEEEPEFREQVNRYIHDFEAMLRRVLADRDGTPLGVTLLSSDMGKLYVALAQAIDRLRS